MTYEIAVNEHRDELRRLLEEAELPWTIEQATPNMDGPNWRLRREGKAGIIISAHEYGFYGRGELIVAAVNALPDLLDALDTAERLRGSAESVRATVSAERVQLAALIERVRELHRPMSVDALLAACAAEECEHEFECPTIEMTVCKGCYDLGDRIDKYNYEQGGIEHVSYPCPTIQALDRGE